MGGYRALKSRLLSHCPIRSPETLDDVVFQVAVDVSLVSYSEMQKKNFIEFIEACEQYLQTIES